MKRRQTSTVDYFVIIRRGNEEINLGPFCRCDVAERSGRAHSRPGDNVEVEKARFDYNWSVSSLVEKETVLNWVNL